MISGAKVRFFQKLRTNYCTLFIHLSKIAMHTFKDDIRHIPLPEQFTYPFHYTPHALCVKATEEVQAYLQTRTDWHEELQQGKMFGVLIVRHPEGTIGYLAAFSGNLVGSNHHDCLVPPVYDLRNPDGYFKQEEARISSLNDLISVIFRTESSTTRQTTEGRKYLGSI